MTGRCRFCVLLYYKTLLIVTLSASLVSTFCFKPVFRQPLLRCRDGTRTRRSRTDAEIATLPAAKSDCLSQFIWKMIICHHMNLQECGNYNLTFQQVFLWVFCSFFKISFAKLGTSCFFSPLSVTEFSVVT